MRRLIFRGYPVWMRAWRDGYDRGRVNERARLLAELRNFLPQYVGVIVHGHTLSGEPIYAAGATAFPDALVDTFEMMTTPDMDGPQ